MKTLHSAARAATMALAKVVIMLECTVLAGLMICAQPVEEAQAQWATPQYSVPIGKDAGTGFSYAAPGAAGYPFTSNGAAANPSFQQIIAAAINTSGNNPISGTFQGNNNPGYFWQSVLATASHATAIDWTAQFTMSSANGTPGTASQVRGALYAHCVADGTSGDCYGANIISQASSGLNTLTNVISLEVNQNNNKSDRPTSCFEYGCDAGNGQYYGLVFGHGGVHLSSAAIYITDLSAGSAGRWQRAIALGPSAASRAVIEDQSNSTYGWLATGTKTTALDFSGATLTNFAYLPNNAAVWQKDAGGTLRSVFVLNNLSQLQIGDSAVNILSNSTIAPSTDNSKAIGGSSNRWTNLHAFELDIYGSSSGHAAIVAPAAAGTPTITTPTGSGTIAVSASAPLAVAATGNITITGAALTKTDDTNVTLTLGGSPTSALVNAASITAGWTGRLAVGRGGTGIGSGTSGGVPYFSASNTIASSAALTANAIVLGGGAGAAPSTASGCSITSGYSINCSSSASFTPAWIVTNTSGDASAGSVTFQKTVSGGDTTSGTQLGGFVFQGRASAAIQNAAQIVSTQNAASSGANVPTRIDLITSSTGGQLNQTLTFNHAAHLYATQAGTTTVGTCGTSPSVTGSDFYGTVTTGSTATTACTVTFATAFASTPHCIVTGQDSGFGAMWVTPGTGTLVVNYGSVTSKKFTYQCTGS